MITTKFYVFKANAEGEFYAVFKDGWWGETQNESEAAVFDSYDEAVECIHKHYSHYWFVRRVDID